eukprot:4850217-Amphidinium_carterae.1
MRRDMQWVLRWKDWQEEETAAQSLPFCRLDALRHVATLADVAALEAVQRKLADPSDAVRSKAGSCLAEIELRSLPTAEEKLWC